MGMAVGTGSGPKSDINITPYIDILLVLLIIFMVITPTKQLDLEVKVPQEAPKTDKPLPPPPGLIVVSMSDTAQLAINQEPISISDLGVKLRRSTAPGRTRICLSARVPSFPYGDVVKIIDIAKGAGVLDVGLLTEEIR